MKTIKDFFPKSYQIIEFLDLPKYQIIVVAYKSEFYCSYMHKELDSDPRHHYFASLKSALQEANRIFNILS